MTTLGPRQLLGKRGKEVVEGQGQDDIVVDTDDESNDCHGVTQAWAIKYNYNTTKLCSSLNQTKLNTDCQ